MEPTEGDVIIFGEISGVKGKNILLCPLFLPLPSIIQTLSTSRTWSTLLHYGNLLPASEEIVK